MAEIAPRKMSEDLTFEDKE